MTTRTETFTEDTKNFSIQDHINAAASHALGVQEAIRTDSDWNTNGREHRALQMLHEAAAKS